MSGSPPALFSGVIAGWLQQTSDALEPARAFAIGHLPPRVVPVSCAFSARTAKKTALYVLTSDGLFFELSIDEAKGGDMQIVREFSCVIGDASLSTVLRRAGVQK